MWFYPWHFGCKLVVLQFVGILRMCDFPGDVFFFFGQINQPGCLGWKLVVWADQSKDVWRSFQRHRRLDSWMLYYLQLMEKTSYLPPRKLTWNLKLMVSNRNRLFQGFIFRFHVSFSGVYTSLKNWIMDNTRKFPPSCRRNFPSS